MTGSTIAALFGTMLILSAAPGPSDFAVVARSISAGFIQAIIMVSGIVVADFLFIALAVLSLAEVAESMGNLFLLVKYACGIYLVWLGVGSIRRRPKTEEVPEMGEASGYSSFLGGFMITLGDPKAIFFYLGLFPAFVDLPNITVADTILIMIIATVVIGGVKITYAWLADRAKLMFENPATRKKMDMTAGIVLIGVGVFLILNNQLL
ncbi:MAG: LysE family translocator [Gammaproteobacteria bacterium]|nr:LysE family translocator [Gammaproteobacteria bacterium]